MGMISSKCLVALSSGCLELMWNQRWWIDILLENTFSKLSESKLASVSYSEDRELNVQLNVLT